MTIHRKKVVSPVATLICMFVAAGSAAADSFTYQGLLRTTDGPVSGSAQLSFQLFDQATGGNLLAEQSFADVPVEEGRFSVVLDLGTQQYADGPLWLDIAVDGQPLSPRQPITAAPFALQTRGLTTTEDLKVGVGISNPRLKLHVNGRAIIQQGADATAGVWFKNATSPNEFGNAFVGMSDDDHLGFYGAGGGGWGLLMKRQNGWIGIKTSDPQAELDVAGAARIESLDVSTSIQASELNVNGWTRTQVLQITGGSDIAEPFNVRGEGELLPGMVVAIDPARVGELRVADQAYDTTVAGIISGANGVNAGLTLTQTDSVADGKHPVALTGRVWCWADADAGGPIQAGDLLTTSPTPGHAMKVQDRGRAAGATLGKAMSSLKGGRGYVLVLVNLQ